MGDFNGVKVCIGNYDYYHEGDRRTVWITLPKTKEEIQEEIRSFLKENDLYDSTHDVIYIADYDLSPFGLHPNNLLMPQTNIDDLNLLASLVELRPDAVERVQQALDCGIDAPDNVVGLMNWIAQADDIPYYEYDFEHINAKDRWGETAALRMSPGELMGWTAIEQNPKLKELLDCDMAFSQAFDVEEYGKTIGFDYDLGRRGYVDCTLGMPAEDAYSREELVEIVASEKRLKPTQEKTKDLSALQDEMRDSAAARNSDEKDSPGQGKDER